jgi:hypothetical protein
MPGSALNVTVRVPPEADRAEQLVKAAEKGEPWAIRELMDRIDGKVPQATILQGDAEEPVRYVEVPRKAANAKEWIACQGPALRVTSSTELLGQINPVTDTDIEG